MTWRVDREVAVLLGSGSRALLLQVAHPKVAAAVVEHSRFRSDPLGRLRDTLDAIYGFAFEDTARVEQIVRRINRLHARVRGEDSKGEAYSALDPHLLLWVYATLIDSSMLAYETFVAPLAEYQRETYYAEFRHAGPIWGIPGSSFPATLTDLRDWMAGLISSGEVQVSAQGREVGRYILDPRVWWMPPPAAFVVRLLTLWLLPSDLRDGFGYDWDPKRERAARTLAKSCRWLVPRLPRALRDLPIARRAERRTRPFSVAARSGIDAAAGPSFPR